MMQADSLHSARYSDAVQAAAAVFSERGYHEATTRQIAKKLKIRRGSIYHYFDSKDAALEEVCRTGVVEILVGLEAIQATDLAADEKIHAALENHLTYLSQQRHFVRACLFCRQNLPFQLQARVESACQRYDEIIESIFEDGVRQGCFRAELDCLIATHSFFALVNAAAIDYDVTKERTIEQMTESLSEILIKGSQAG